MDETPGPHPLTRRRPESSTSAQATPQAGWSRFLRFSTSVDRAALEPVRAGVRHAFGAFRKDIARGLTLRCDWGPQYIADAWINEVKWLGISISPSYVGEPECNGVIERFMRTLKEQCIYLHRFHNLAEARRVIGEFIARYNAEWLIERLGYRTPTAARAAAIAA